MVDFPEPELPTNAVTDPEGTWKLILFNTSFPSSYAKETLSKTSAPSIFSNSIVLFSSSSSADIFINSSVLSRPANASVNWLPILLICTIGAIIKPNKKVKDKNSPTVSSPVIILYPPIPIIPVVARPNKKVAALDIIAVAVKLFFTFWNNLSTPFSNVSFSCASALNAFITLTPDNVSVNLPFTSALITPLLLKIGRIYLNAFKATTPNTATGTNTKKVIDGLIWISNIIDITAVIVPPTSWTKPVPIKFRTPSTSLIILETNAPDFVLSKKRIGNDNTFFWTCALSSDIKYCACTLKIRVSKKEVTACTKIAKPTISNRLYSCS